MRGCARGGPEPGIEVTGYICTQQVMMLCRRRKRDKRATLDSMRNKTNLTKNIPTRKTIFALFRLPERI